MISAVSQRLSVLVVLPLTLALVVGSTSSALGQSAKTKIEKAKLDLNTATAKEMEAELTGVGEVTAKKIIAGRPYTSIDDLAKAGIPAKTIEAIRSQVTVSSKTKMPVAASTATEKTTKPTPKSAVGKIDVNTATAEELQTLPGIGPVLAKEIIDSRPHKAIEDLEKLKGLGKSKFAAIRDLVTVDSPTPTLTPTPAKVAAKPQMTKTKSAAPTPKSASTASSSGKIVNLNTASKEDLDALPGIGPVKAQAILDARPFKTIEDVMKVKGIKQGEFAKIKDLITVD